MAPVNELQDLRYYYHHHCQKKKLSYQTQTLQKENMKVHIIKPPPVVARRPPENCIYGRT